MVEIFNKTLATILTVYVFGHQHDQDKHLPYGPFVIEEKHINTTYKIQNKDFEKTLSLIVHVDRLYLYGTQVLSNKIKQLTNNEHCAKDKSLSDDLQGD